MLHKIVDIIKSSTYQIKDGTLFCNDYIIVDLDCIEFLEAKNITENILNTKQVGDRINLELSLAHLNSIGYYEDCETFILKNKYCSSTEVYYIEEIKCFSSASNAFIHKYLSVINLICAIKNIAKHTYTDADIENSIVFREDQFLFLPFKYDSSDIIMINSNDIDKLNSISNVLLEANTEKKLLFINELVDFLNRKEENNRFKFLLSQYIDFYEKCNNAYQFYLSDFSYHKLKIELDSKALDYTQRIQSVINESQTKLIAIPTAFVLVFAAFDFVDLFAIKNVSVMLSLIIFAILIQLFLNNQKSTLNFIRENILSYKEIFNNNKIDEISSKFSLVDKELQKQRNRLGIVEVILWLIPFALICLWLFLIDFQTISCLLYLLFIIIVVVQKIFIR